MKIISKISAIVIVVSLFISVSAFLIPKSETQDDGDGGGGIFKRSSNIGGMKLLGTVNFDGTTQVYTLTGGGMNVWGSLDQHFYLWNTITGDFSLTTKVAFEGVNPAHRKVGIMVREELTGNAKCVHVDYHGDLRTSLQYRSETGGQTREIVAPEDGNYMTLERVGNKFFMRSATGIKPTAITAEVEMDLPATVYVGLFICSHEADILEKGYFSNVVFKK